VDMVRRVAFFLLMASLTVLPAVLAFAADAKP